MAREDKWFSLRTDFLGMDAAHLGIYQLSPQAIATYIVAVAYASRWGLDYCPRGILRNLGIRRSKPVIDELVQYGFLVPRIGDRKEFFVAHEGTLWCRGTPLQRHPIPTRIRAAVMERDGFACVECGSPDELTLDHIHPYSRGGTDEADNLRVLCRSCNSRKGARV